MAEFIYGEPSSIIETHIGHVPLRAKLERHIDDPATAENTVDLILGALIEASRPYSGFATLFLKRVKEGRV